MAYGQTNSEEQRPGSMNPHPPPESGGGLGRGTRCERRGSPGWRSTRVSEPHALFPRQQFGFQGAALSETADAEDSESQHTSLVVYTLHDGVMAGRPHESWRIAEQNF